MKRALAAVALIATFGAGSASADPINLSLFATAAANSIYDFWLPSRAIDGSDFTGWNAGDHGTPEDPNWLVVDLGGIHAVSQVHVYWEEPDHLFAGFTTIYNFYTGATGSDWTLRTSGTFVDESTLANRELTLDVTDLEMRYAKYEVIGGAHWSAVAEIEIIGPATPVPDRGSTLLLLGMSVDGIAAFRKWRG